MLNITHIILTMNLLPNEIPIKTTHLFPKLDQLLIQLLTSLTLDEWDSPTIAKLWTIKDIASHLLDGNLRGLSFSRDKFFGETPPDINSYADLIGYLNQLNATWTSATKRVSPQVLIELLEITGKQYSDHLESLDPFEPAIFSVAWAGQEQSENWFHIAREYTEKYIHQQQIREAVGSEALLTKELFYPFIDTFMFGLPYTYRNTAADLNTVVTVKVLTQIGGEWHIIKRETGWELSKVLDQKANATISITPQCAWKLFSKGISPSQALEEVDISGDQLLGKIALNMISVMA